ncbi:unnamed protein product [Cladocopium goreaui]|uniref:Uncharacterized protein n=1 Tax=Cladocopium goreaui TaxID=2562237 RepID=A0A9P1D2Q1_9DINO|nr:unnamed protein product [Cladocopium goreaui]
MAVSPTNKQGKPTYYFEVRVNWDKLMAIDQQTESFKAQVFLEATLRYPKKVNSEDEADVLTIFQRATVENWRTPWPNRRMMDIQSQSSSGPRRTPWPNGRYGRRMDVQSSR